MLPLPFVVSNLLSARRTEHRNVTAVRRYVVTLLAAPTGSATKPVDITSCYLEGVPDEGPGEGALDLYCYSPGLLARPRLRSCDTAQGRQ